MLTRVQVARRLGRSVATVRRLEGNALHPDKDARGVNRFDPVEVDEVAERLRAAGSVSELDTDCGGGASQDSADLDPADVAGWNDPEDRAGALLAEVETLRTERDEAQGRARRAVSDLDRFRARTAEGLAALGQELVRLDPDLGEVVLAMMHDLFE